MAKNKPDKPDNVKIIPENETAEQEQTAPTEAGKITDSAPAPEMATEEAALHEIGNDGLEQPTSFDIPAPGNEIVSEEQKLQQTAEVSDNPAAEEVETPVHEGEAALQDIGHDGLEPPFDIPTLGDVVVPFEKINEIISGKQSAARKVEKDSNTQLDKAAPEVEETRQEWEKPLDEVEPKGKSRQSKKTEKAEKNPSHPAKQEKAPKPDKSTEQTQGGNIGGDTVSAEVTEQAQQETPPLAPELPPEPRESPRPGEQEQIVYLNLSELHAFKNHPFQVRNDDEMAAMVESVKDKGVTQPAIVRPREDGGYEIVSGHRRQKASELAGFADMPCIIRNLTDEQAITQMVEDNTNQRENILPSERAKALQMQLEAIKQQGVRTGNGQRSNEVVAERNKMTVKQVQRYIKLNELVPELMKMVDEKKIAFTPAVELAFIKPKNQKYIAIAIEGQQSAPSLSQAQRMRDLDQKKLLNPDMIDGIMLEEKKEVDKVILSSQELGQYFGKEKTPREMKDTIMKLLEENKDKLKDISAPEKKAEQEK